MAEGLRPAMGARPLCAAKCSVILRDALSEKISSVRSKPGEKITVVSRVKATMRSSSLYSQRMRDLPRRPSIRWLKSPLMEEAEQITGGASDWRPSLEQSRRH